MKNLQNSYPKVLALASLFALVFLFIDITSYAGNGPDNTGATVVVKSDGEIITLLYEESIYVGEVHSVRTPSGHFTSICNGRLVAGPGVQKVTRLEMFRGVITLTPGGAFLWKFCDDSVLVGVIL